MPTTDRPPKPEHVEELIDEMSKESFPASDAPQLDGVLEGGRAARVIPRHPPEHAPPPEAARRDDDEELETREGRYALGEAGELWLCTHVDSVEVKLPAATLRLDAAGLERLIDALERHRPSLRGGH